MDCGTQKEMASRVNANRLKKYNNPSGRKYVNLPEPTSEDLQQEDEQQEPDQELPSTSTTNGQQEGSHLSPVGKTVVGIKSCRRHGNSRLYRAIAEGEDKLYELSPEQVPPALLRDYHAKYNLRGRVRSRRGKKPRYLNASAS